MRYSRGRKKGEEEKIHLKFYFHAQFGIEIEETSMLSKLMVAPKLYYAGYTLDHKGFMVLEEYDFSLLEYSRLKNRHNFYKYESELRNQIHSLLNKMIYNGSIYNSDIKIQNIVVKIDTAVDIRMIDFDPQYCKTSFDAMHTYEYHYKIDFSTNRVKMYRQACK